ncbi:MAG: DUF397 domain-containing protein [Streptosporangiaceae bacterium]
MSEPEHASLTWHKSSASGADQGCVEVAVGPRSVYVRNSRDSAENAPTLAFLHSDWAAFLVGVRNDEFELPA